MRPHVGRVVALCAEGGMEHEKHVDVPVVVSRVRNAVRAVVVKSAEIDLSVAGVENLPDHLPRPRHPRVEPLVNAPRVVCLFVRELHPIVHGARYFEESERDLIPVLPHCPRRPRAREEQPVDRDVRHRRNRNVAVCAENCRNGEHPPEGELRGAKRPRRRRRVHAETRITGALEFEALDPGAFQGECTLLLRLELEIGIRIAPAASR
jgi:hypothetical protein